jgi:hypothetical protein
MSIPYIPGMYHTKPVVIGTLVPTFVKESETSGTPKDYGNTENSGRYISEISEKSCKLNPEKINIIEEGLNFGRYIYDESKYEGITKLYIPSGMLVHLKCGNKVWSIVGTDNYVHMNVCNGEYSFIDNTVKLQIGVQLVEGDIPDITNIKSDEEYIYIGEKAYTYDNGKLVLVSEGVWEKDVLEEDITDNKEMEYSDENFKFTINANNVLNDLNNDKKHQLQDLTVVKKIHSVNKNHILFLCDKNVCTYFVNSEKWQLVHALECNSVVYLKNTLLYIDDKKLYSISFT